MYKDRNVIIKKDRVRYINMKIAIRLDDITPDMDWSKFKRVRAILDKYEVKPLIGVVPDNKDVKLHKEEARLDFWEIIKELEVNKWCISLHGYNHCYTEKKGGLFPLNRQSEFAGLPLDGQIEIIKSGDDILKENGIITNIFMAPSHTYDSNTLKALKICGYRYITDGYAKRPYIRLGVVFFPISFSRYISFKKKSGYTTFVYHLNEMSEEEIDFFEEFIVNNRDKVIDYSDFYSIKPFKRNIVGNTKEYVMAVFKRVMLGRL